MIVAAMESRGRRHGRGGLRVVSISVTLEVLEPQRQHGASFGRPSANRDPQDAGSLPEAGVWHRAPCLSRSVEAC
jgi:hypothetical protein